MTVIGNQQSVVPDNLPKLPGYAFKDPTSTNFNKSHLFDIQNGVPKINDLPTAAKVPLGAIAAPSAAAAPAMATTQPAWVELDRKVLRYNCHFKEAVHESRLETFRIRKCVLYYYLEDDSIHISEPKVDNSGIPQGERKGTIFLKRHKVLKPDGTFYTASDLNVGVLLDLYGRAFLLTDADYFTRAYMAKAGVTVAPAVDAPADPYTSTRAEILKNQQKFYPRPAEDDLMRCMEARLGMAASLLDEDKLERFIKNDRKVLRFYMAWDDRNSLYGELRPFILHYYLADDTMEILEVRAANAGRDPFPLYLKRGKVFKNLASYLNIDAPTTHTTQLIGRTGKVDPETMIAFTETDFAVGKTVQINGVDFLIYACDAFTREYYSSTYGTTFEDISVEFSEAQERPQMVIPPHVPPGSEEDSLGSFLYLSPKVPKKNFRRMMENDRKILRFLARLDNSSPEDSGRVFVIKYFLADDTVAVFEPPQKNSGVIGGKFLERCRIKKPNSHEFFCQADFYTGAVLHMNEFKFVVYQADEYTLAYMESDPDSHPMSNLEYILEQLKPVLKEKEIALNASFVTADPSATGLVSYEAFQGVLAANSMELNDQVLITLMRRFDLNKDGNISYSSMMSLSE
jgi:hypothetical protein